MTLRIMSIMMDGALYTCSLPDTCSFHVTLEPDLQHTNDLRKVCADVALIGMQIVMDDISQRPFSVQVSSAPLSPLLPVEFLDPFRQGLSVQHLRFRF